MKFLISLLSVLILVCATITYAANSSQPEPPENVVQSLYRDFGWELKSVSNSKKLLIDQPIQVLNRYFTPKLAELIKKDRKHEIKTKDLGHLDFVLLCGSQDPDGITNIRIDGKPGKDVVTVTYDQSGEKDVMKIEFNTQKTKSGWRISDVHYKTRKSNAFPAPGINLRLLDLLSQPYE
ncbi:DUF3828 domain-containing protein [Geomobilimonas luticola]|uniref:DUF3828 domain-containing protein n=1 Tax=Geomobilimonas luticola TaxID=1114878 RepID=A0ABS5S8S1_9BACT|nr:DUF3828 domain-containing protein [Geomobilimonas luticola]MBT0651773.1 DUF3828 domain-containing protein [Geomobilimonas luticola]